MSYRTFIRSLITTVRQNWRKPSWIAAFASVGIHGVLGVVLPILPSSSKEIEEPDTPQSVGLLELSPTEQSRLPDFSVPTVSPPTLSTPDSDLYSLSPLPNQFSAVPNSPLPFPSYRIPSEIPFPPFPPPSNTPSRRQTRNLGGRPSPRQTTPPPPPSSSPTPEASPSPEFSGTTALGDLDSALGGRSPNSTSPTPQPQASNAPITSASPSGAPPSPTPEELAQQRQRELYSYNETGTGETEGGNRATGWFAEQRGQTWDGSTVPPRVEIVAAIPAEACAIQIESLEQAETWFGAVVDADGKIKGDPEPLRSSGYAGLNQAAQEAIASYEFENTTGGDRAYFVIVRFERDAETCAAPSADG